MTTSMLMLMLKELKHNGLKTILRGLAGLLRTKTKKLNRTVQTKKEMAIQALNLLQMIIKENEISDTDILINTIRDYIKK